MTDLEFTIFVTLVTFMPMFGAVVVLAINSGHIAEWFSLQRYCLRCWLRDTKDRVCIWLAWHVLPKRLVMWSFMRVGAWATTGAYSNQNATTLTFLEAAKRWETA